MRSGFPYSSPQIYAFIKAAKCVRAGQKMEFRAIGESGKTLAIDLDLMDGGFVDLKLFLNTSDADQPERYTAALVLNGVRVRGVDFSPVAIRRRYKVRVPRGWHENLVDPNLSKKDDDENRHIPLPEFAPTDLSHFLRLIVERWNIEMPTEPTLL